MKTKLLLLMAFICQISFAQVSNADLLAYYPFDTDANNHAPGATQFNLSVFGNGSLYTAPLLQTTDKIKGAGSYQFFFNGRTLATDDFSSLPNKSLSVSYWMRLPNGPSSANPLRTGVEFYGSLFMRGYFNFGVSTTDGKFDVYNYDSTTSSTGPWSHCVLVFDAETNYIKAYLNGQLVASKAVFINNIHQYAPKMMIGGGFNATLDDIEPSKSLPGNIDEMYVYNRVLTDSEITALYNLEDPIATVTTPTIGCWRDVKVGYNHMVGLKYDGTIWAWGLNNNGQLGNGTTTNSSTPVQVGTDNDWDVISAGGKASYAIKKNGTLWAWGENIYGQLGNGNPTPQLTPIQVGIDNGWTDVSAGFEHVIAIKNGELFGWGRNHVGQIGQSNLTNFTTPVKYGNSNWWKKIATGLYHSFAINENQRLYASGFNANGQLGIGSINNASLFVQVTNATTWREIACGSYHSLAMRNENVGLGWGWGLNNWTQIGNNGSNANAPTNYTYPNNVSLIDKMAAGESHSLFITDGQLLVRGRNTEGQLGISNNTQQTSWVVAGNNWSVIAAGQNMSAGINRNGELFTWGQNTFGQLGIGSTTNANSPQAVGCPTTTLSSTTFHKLEDLIKIYPNPFNSQITFDLGNSYENVTVLIHDITGKQLYKNSFSGNQLVVNNLGNLPSGIYVATLTTENGTSITKKIVK